MPNRKLLTKYIACWVCDHFQRYSREEGEATFCVGECRYAPIAGYAVGEVGIGPDPTLLTFSWPVIMSSAAWRCGRFEKTQETDLPDIATGTCGKMQFDELKQYKEAFWFAPWNKKILPGYVSTPEKGVSCWNCDHFQPQPGTETGADGGFCRANPPLWFNLIDSGAGWNNFESFWVDRGPCFWCGQWEKATHSIAAPYDGYLCEAAQQ